MADTIDKSNVDSFTPTIVASKAFGQLREKTILPNIVNTDYSTEVAEQGETVEVPKRGTVSSNDKQANTAYTLQNPEDSNVSVTLDTHKEATFLIEDPARAFANQGDNGLIDGYMEDSMGVLAEDVETAILELATGFSTSAGTAGTDVAVDDLPGYRKDMVENKVPSYKRKFLILDPKDIENLLTTEEFTSSAWADDQGLAIREGTLGRKFGFEIIEHSMVTTTAGSPTQYDNMAIAKDAIVLVTRALPTVNASYGVRQAIVTDSESGLTMRVSMSWDTDYGGIKTTVEILFGVAELRDEFGLHIKS